MLSHVSVSHLHVYNEEFSLETRKSHHRILFSPLYLITAHTLWILVVTWKNFEIPLRGPMILKEGNQVQEEHGLVRGVRVPESWIKNSEHRTQTPVSKAFLWGGLWNPTCISTTTLLLWTRDANEHLKYCFLHL